MINPQNDNAVMTILGVQELRHFVCNTNKGDLMLQIRKDEHHYTFLLDSVPIEEAKNRALLKSFYPHLIENIVGTVTKGSPFSGIDLLPNNKMTKHEERNKIIKSKLKSKVSARKVIKKKK